jgi:hypothetical protein
MLGTPYTGRLPTTQANLDLLKNRIRQVQYQMNTLDQQVARGQIDSRAAGYRRQQLIGEVAELKRKIANSRLSTPSYRVPRDLQKFRGSKPAKKLISDSHSDGMPQNYFGTDTRGNHVSITSDWEATAPARLDVPDLPKQSGFNVKYPRHWPGQHSPMIMRAVMEAGEVGGRQMIDPREPAMQIRGDLVRDPRALSAAYALKARYEQLLSLTEGSLQFTITDRKLVNTIYGKINRQITLAEEEIERLKMLKPDPTSEFEKSKRVAMPLNPGADDTKTGDKTPTPIAPPAKPSPAKPSPAKPSLPSLPRTPSFPQVPSFPQMPGANMRRSGLMGLGSASRNFNAMKADRGISPSQERSLNQARRELTMAKARAGARVDITKQIKEEPVTRPWSLQVSLPPQKLQELHSMIDMALMQTNLNQAMFTQQAHNYVASIINSLSSDMTPTQQTEYVVERIMSEMVNRSALLKKDVKVDINPTNMGVRFEEQQEQNIEGLGSGLLKTKAAMGRLLG